MIEFDRHAIEHTMNGYSKNLLSAFEQQSVAERKAVEARENHNRSRREKYASDAAYAARIRVASKEYYAIKSPKQPSLLANGLLKPGIVKEICLASSPAIAVSSRECYTLPGAAKALGRTELTFKRWIREALIPEPIYQEATNGYRIYTAEEVRAMGEILAAHEEESRYYTSRHGALREQLFEMVEQIRGR